MTEQTAKAPRKSRAKKTAGLPSGEGNTMGENEAQDHGKPPLGEPGILETIESEAVVEDAAAVVKEVKRRKPSGRERDEVGKVVRKGRNLSGNQPFRGKPYYYDLDAAEEIGEAAYNAAPMQVRLILKYMREEGITTIDDAMRGGEIAGGAINGGYLQSKIEPAALFAYYRRLMERLGVRLAYEEA